MSKICSPDALKNILENRQIQSATSSLNRFVMKFVDGTALILEGLQEQDSVGIQASIAQSTDISDEDEAVCRVDWSWICSSSIATVDCRKEHILFQLNPAGPLRISVQLWQNKPFLAFQPYRSMQ